MNIKPRNKISYFFYRNIILLFGFLIINLFFIHNALAATLFLSTNKETVSQQEEFQVDVSLLPDKNENINAFDISISYSPSLSFVGEKDRTSIVGLWIEKPNEKNRLVNFSGIMPGGFSGLIDPMSSDPINNLKPGLLAELIFVGEGEGSATVSFSKKNVLANDGLGTYLETNTNSIKINVDKTIVPSTINIDDSNPPEQFSITLSEDPLLFNGKYAIIFDTKDKESGINYYEVKEEGSNWQKGENQGREWLIRGSWIRKDKMH